VQRVAVVTAGCHGLGRAITERLARAGYRIVATSRRPDAADRDWAERLSDGREAGVEVLPWRPDDPDASARLVGDTVGLWGRLDVLVCNAGPYHRPPLPLADTPEMVWRAMWEGNVFGTLRLVQAALPVLRRSGSGRVLTLGFVGAGQAWGWPEHGAYAAAKASLASLTRTLALEEHRFGITSNMVCPSDIKRVDKERVDRGEDGPPRPIGGDVAELIQFLAKPESQFITGQVWETAFAWGSDPGRIGVGSPTLGQVLPAGTRVTVPLWAETAVVTDSRLDHRGLWYQVRGLASSRVGWLVPEQVEPLDG
jgi:3-oxoacyl-[acyl-carrier protein] reductase